MVASKLNHQIILLLKRPLTHHWTSPLNTVFYKPNAVFDTIFNPFGCAET